MALKLSYLVVRSFLSWARLSWQDVAAKNVEILMAVGSLPGVPDIQITPDVVSLVMLPPLL